MAFGPDGVTISGQSAFFFVDSLGFGQISAGANTKVLNFTQTNGNVLQVRWSGTANRSIDFPDTNGTIALNSQLVSVSNAIQSVGSATGSGTNTSRFAADDHVHAGVFSMGVTNSGNTQGNTRVDVGRFVFLGSNGVTLSQDTAANALNTIRMFGNVVSNAIQAVGSATGSGTNTTRFAADDHVHAGVFSMGVSTGGTTAGDTRVDVGRFVFLGSNMTLSQQTAAGGLNTIVFSVGAGGGGLTNMTVSATSNTTQSSTGTIALSSMIFAGAGAASVGVSNGSIVISAPNAGAGNVTISAGTTSGGLASIVFSDSNQLSFGLNGSTITAGLDPQHTLYPFGFFQGTTGQSFALSVSFTQSFYPFVVPFRLLAQYMQIPLSQSFVTASNSTGSMTMSLLVGIYSQGTGTNSTTLSQITSGQLTMVASANNSTYTFGFPTSTNTAGFTSGTSSSAGSGQTSVYTGVKIVNLPLGNSIMTPGVYWMGLGYRYSSNGANFGFRHSWLGSTIATAFNAAPVGEISANWTTGTKHFLRQNNPFFGLGSYGGGTSALRDTSPLSEALNTGGASLSVMPFFMLWANKT